MQENSQIWKKGVKPLQACVMNKSTNYQRKLTRATHSKNNSPKVCLHSDTIEHHRIAILLKEPLYKLKNILCNGNVPRMFKALHGPTAANKGAFLCREQSYQI